MGWLEYMRFNLYFNLYLSVIWGGGPTQISWEGENYSDALKAVTARKKDGWPVCLPGRQDVLRDLKEKHSVYTLAFLNICVSQIPISPDIRKEPIWAIQEGSGCALKKLEAKSSLKFCPSKTKNVQLLNCRHLTLVFVILFMMMIIMLFYLWYDNVILFMMMMIMLLYPDSFVAAGITQIAVSGKANKKLSIKFK